MTTPRNDSPEGPQWVFAPAPKRRVGRVWLIAVLIAVVVVVAFVTVILTLPRDGESGPSASATPTKSTTATPSPGASSPAPTGTSAPSPAPSQTTTPTPQETEPPVVDPGVAAFREIVTPRLNDAATGLDIFSELSGPDAVGQVVDPLITDGQWLADQPAPSALDSQWRSAVAIYLSSLTDLRSAAASDSDAAGALAVARTALAGVNAVIAG